MLILASVNISGTKGYQQESKRILCGILILLLCMGVMWWISFASLGSFRTSICQSLAAWGAPKRPAQKSELASLRSSTGEYKVDFSPSSFSHAIFYSNSMNLLTVKSHV